MLIVEENDVEVVSDKNDNSIRCLAQKILRDGISREDVATAKEIQSQDYGTQQFER